MKTNKFTVIEDTYFSLDALKETENGSHTDEQTALAQANATISGPKRYTADGRFSLTPVIINNETNDERDGLLVEELNEEAPRTAGQAHTERTARIEAAAQWEAAQLNAQQLRAFVKLLDFNEQLKNEILPIIAHNEAAFNLDYRIQTWLNDAQEELQKFIEKARIDFKK
jgi:hypothetical protein